MKSKMRYGMCISLLKRDDDEDASSWEDYMAMIRSSGVAVF